MDPSPSKRMHSYEPKVPSLVCQVARRPTKRAKENVGKSRRVTKKPSSVTSKSVCDGTAQQRQEIFPVLKVPLGDPSISCVVGINSQHPLYQDKWDNGHEVEMELLDAAGGQSLGLCKLRKHKEAAVQTNESSVCRHNVGVGTSMVGMRKAWVQTNIGP